MIDPVLDAVREYEREVAPAYEVIRRARARLLAHISAADGDPVPVAPIWAAIADPTEPNGAEFAVEAIEPPVASVAAGADGEVEASARTVAASPDDPRQEVPSPRVAATAQAGEGAPPATQPGPSLSCSCGRSFARPAGLGRHRTASGHDVAPAPPGMEIHGGRERWLCGRCEAFFSTRSSRDKHQATHPPIPHLVPVQGRHGPREVDAVLHPGGRP